MADIDSERGVRRDKMETGQWRRPPPLFFHIYFLWFSNLYIPSHLFYNLFHFHFVCWYIYYFYFYFDMIMFTKFWCWYVFLNLFRSFFIFICVKEMRYINVQAIGKFSSNLNDQVTFSNKVTYINSIRYGLNNLILNIL